MSASEEFKDVIIIAPDERDVFSEGLFGDYEKGPRKGKEGLTLPNSDWVDSKHATGSEEGHWNVYRNGKMIEQRDGDWEPEDYEVPAQ